VFEQIQTKRVLILGCGNVLMGDDGFGPAVVKKLKQQYAIPADAHVEDVGTSVRDILFNICLSDARPEHIVILDAADRPGREPGEVFFLSLDDIPEEKIIDYSFHQFPTSNLLKEVRDQCGIKVTVIAAQISGKLEEVRPGLSGPVRAAVRRASDRVAELLGDD
jgi:coenzyme F420 hydrogenase subunit delta